MLYGHYTNPCPALMWNGDRYLCSLYLGDPSRYEHFLEIGGGCCFPSNPRRRNDSKEPWQVSRAPGTKDKTPGR